MRAGRGVCELPQTRQRDVCTPDTLRCSPHLREGRDGLQKNLTFALFLQRGFRHSTSTSSEREARLCLLSPKAKGAPGSAARRARVLGEATRPTGRHVLRDSPPSPSMSSGTGESS